MTTATKASINEQVVRIGRVAIGTQGLLYGVVGLLAVQVARGDRGTEASQSGALASVVRQPFGRVLLVVLVIGLVAHATWRLILGVRGEPGDDEDSKSVAKRAANGGRVLLYVALIAGALGLLTSSSGSSGSGEQGAAGGSGGSGGSSEQELTARVLSWPGGKWIVVAVGLAVIAAGVWNAKRGVTRSFLEALDLSSLDESKRRTVEILGTAGYLARGVVFALIGWFLVTAGRQGDAEETRGLDAVLQELADTSHGPILLLVLAVGMVLFGIYRIADAVVRRPSEITHA